MNYEKKYKEALERAQKAIRAGGDVAMEIVQHIFPELRESEDERIRKELIFFLKEEIPQCSIKEHAEKLKEFVAWLEKQKYDRMKPIYDARESFESALEKAWNDYHNGYENVDKLEDDYVECAHAKGFREGYLFGIEKQKEQKPWKVGANAYFTPEQKPVVTHGETYHVDTLGTQQVIAGKMPQKPAEWSEDDKGILLSVKCVIDEVWHSKNNTTDCPADELEEMWHWLDTLWQRVEYPQPSWKPSEEQMKALEVAFRKDGDDNYRSTINSLYNDLKKL